jgi:hypothetical protein
VVRAYASAARVLGGGEFVSTSPAGAVSGTRRQPRRVDAATRMMLTGAIIVFREYDPVRNESVTVKSACITSRTFCCRAETVGA